MFSLEPVTITDVCRMWRQCSLSTLWSEDLWRLQGILQENCPEERQVCLPGWQELSCGQETEEQMSVLSLPEVFGSRDGEGSCKNRQPQRKKRPTANQASRKSRDLISASGGSHHILGPSSCGVNTKIGKSWLHPGMRLYYSSSSFWMELLSSCMPILHDLFNINSSILILNFN